MSCTPFSGLMTFSGSVTIVTSDGKQTVQNYGDSHLNKTLMFAPRSSQSSNCYSRSGNTLTIKSSYGGLNFTNTLTDVNGKITGTLSFPGLHAAVQVNGTGGKFL